MKIGWHIKIIRRRKVLSQKALAELVGRSEEWLRQIESGERPIRKLDSVIILAEALGVNDLSELTGGLFSSSRIGRPKHQAEDRIRQALTRSLLAWELGPDPGITTSSMTRRIEYAWEAWHQSRRQYTALGILLPDLLSDAVRFHRTCPEDLRRGGGVGGSMR